MLYGKHEDFVEKDMMVHNGSRSLYCQQIQGLITSLHIVQIHHDLKKHDVLLPAATALIEDLVITNFKS
jgi:dihydrofolate reductase